MRALVIGPQGFTHIAGSFVHGGAAAGVDARAYDIASAFAGPRWWRSVSWRLMRRPTQLSAYSLRVVEECVRQRAEVLITTGLAPVDARALSVLGDLGIKRLNFLTDDPWSETNRSRWFFDAARRYDAIFTPRRANLSQLAQLTGKTVTYLPFGYDPRHFHGNDAITDADRAKLGSQVLFVGGGDRDRLPYMTALLDAGVRLALYGGYWDRFEPTRRANRGVVDATGVRLATRTTEIAICLVRRANRDGHVMRSFEIPAVGACMLAEDTEEHREIFGPEGQTVRYFTTPQAMVATVRELLAAPDERSRLAQAAHALVTEGAHTYADRLRSMVAGV